MKNSKFIVVGTITVFCIALLFVYFSAAFTRHFFSIKAKKQCYETMLVFCSRVEKNIPAGSVIFIGDSHIQGLCVTSVTCGGVNLGIGGETTQGLIERLRSYKNIARASAIVIAVGVNDIIHGQQQEILSRYKTIIDVIPPAVPTVICAVFPVDPQVAHKNINKLVRSINKQLGSLCSAYNNCLLCPIPSRLVDESGNLAARMHVGDGIHLNAEGYWLWIASLKKILGSVTR